MDIYFSEVIFEIGDYSIEYMDDKTIWVTNCDGEGGTLKIEDLHKVIDKFYKDNFEMYLKEC